MSRLWFGAASILALIGCGEESPTRALPQRPAQTAGAFTMLLSPMEGTAVIVPKAADIYYTGWSAADTTSSVTLTTAQNQVSYVDSTGVCHSNNGPTCNVATTGPNRCSMCTTCNACNGLLPTTLPCGARGTFCGPIAMVSSYGFALPDVILQLANRATDTRNSITSCTDSTTLNGGQCARDADNARKVDSMTSALTSPIAGCSYCYGNRPSLTSTNLGLRDAVLPNSSANNTDKVALNLSSGAQFGVDVLVEYPAPVIDSVAIADDGVPASCATPNLSTVTVTGGAFGPQGSCIATNCAVSGLPGGGYVMDFVRQTGMGGGTPFGPVANSTIWSDNTTSATLGTTTGGSTCVARITTPSSATSAQSPTFSVCAGHGNLDHFGLAVLTPNVTAGNLFTFSLVAQDANNARVTNATGAVSLTMVSRNGGSTTATFVFATPNSNPATYTWVPTDSGGHLFTNGARAGMSGPYRITAAQGSIAGSVDFTVNQ